VSSLPEKRWQARAGFIRAAKIADGKADADIEVITIDFSLSGAGILVHGRHEPLPERVRLSIDGTVFDCQVRWSNSIGTNATRYGLVFLDVSDVT
jgi:hypothetical protein